MKYFIFLWGVYYCNTHTLTLTYKWLIFLLQVKPLKKDEKRRMIAKERIVVAGIMKLKMKFLVLTKIEKG